MPLSRNNKTQRPNQNRSFTFDPYMPVASRRLLPAGSVHDRIKANSVLRPSPYSIKQTTTGPLNKTVAQLVPVCLPIIETNILLKLNQTLDTPVESEMSPLKHFISSLIPKTTSLEAQTKPNSSIKPDIRYRRTSEPTTTFSDSIDLY